MIRRVVKEVVAMIVVKIKTKMGKLMFVLIKLSFCVKKIKSFA